MSLPSHLWLLCSRPHQLQFLPPLLQFLCQLKIVLPQLRVPHQLKFLLPKLGLPSHLWLLCFRPHQLQLLPFKLSLPSQLSLPNPLPSSRSKISSAPPPASADLRLVVVSIDKSLATQDLCSALPQFFDVCHWGAPIKGSRRSEPERGRRAPMAEATAWRRQRLEQMRS